eukprot:tig00000718_g3719.t1
MAFATVAPVAPARAQAAATASASCSQAPAQRPQFARFAGLRKINAVDRVQFRAASSLHAAVKKAGFAAPMARPFVMASTEVVTGDDMKGETFTRWLLDQQRAGTLDDDLIVLLSSISTACKQIASMVNRAGISNLTGVAGAVNVQGEDQKKLDVVSNDVFKNSLRFTGRMGIIASEEEDEPVLVDEDFAGNYVAVFDPLDGSSNIDAAVSTGSIFGIYEQVHPCILPDGKVTSLDNRQSTCLVDVLQPGENLKVAGYCMYSSSTMLVLTIGTGVVGFTLDPMIGEFVMTHPNIVCPEDGNIYSFNEGNFFAWDKELQDYINHVKNPPSGKPWSLRYIGSLVADIHRTLLYGGIYGYPGDKKNPNGKLRLLYECAPMGFILEQAGGAASTGKGRIMTVKPEKVHQRLPTFLGSKKCVELLENYYAGKA